MSVSIRCPKCSQISQLPDTIGGGVFPCPACGTSLRVPGVTGGTAQPAQPPAPVNPFEMPQASPAQDSDSVYAAYASPSAASGTAAAVPAMKDLPYVYRSAGGLVLTLTLLLAAHILVDIVIGGMEVTRLAIDVNELGAIPLGDDVSLAWFDIAYGIVGLLTVPLSLATAILFLVWVNRANKNARALGAQGMQFTPGWCVGWFFVPIMNLFKPFQAIREIFQASDPRSDATNWKLAGSSGVVGLWWGLWLIGNVLGQIEFRLAMREDDLEASAALGAVNAVLGVILCLVAMQLVRGLHRRQETKAGRSVRTG
jgi:hypothetical protein